ncbi:MAG: ATP F0F1 synthase subunit B [Methylobacteriaceae bacterium]|nr:ATP F0F1 synthase subunit B [Methylobacteriaceae bacterium]
MAGSPSGAADQPLQLAVEVPGGEHHDDVGFPPFKTETFAGQIVWLAISFGLLVYLMNKFVIPRIDGIIVHRKGIISDDLQEATRLKQDADKEQAVYEASLSTAKHDAGRIVQSAYEEQQEWLQAEQKQLDGVLQGKLEQAVKQITARRDDAVKEVNNAASATAAEIVVRLIGRNPSADVLAEAARTALEPKA